PLPGGPGNDTMTGGSGADRFTFPTRRSSDLDLSVGGTADILVVSSGATANATAAGNFTATATTSNSGTATITDAGFTINLSAVTRGSAYAVTTATKSTRVTPTACNFIDTLIG